MNKMVYARVYLKEGNGYLIPGHWYCENDPEIGRGSALNVVCDGFVLCVTHGLTTYGWIDVEIDDGGHAKVDHYPRRLTSPSFEHGEIDLLLIAGPLFDELKTRQRKVESYG